MQQTAPFTHFDFGWIAGLFFSALQMICEREPFDQERAFEGLILQCEMVKGTITRGKFCAFF